MRLLILAAGLSTSAWCCSCARPGPPCQEAWRAAAVFTGTVVEVDEPNLAGLQRIDARVHKRTVRIRLGERLLGVDPKLEEIEIKTGLGGGDCGYGFQRGDDYVVYAYKSREGVLETGICTRTRLLADAKEDVAYFRSLKDAANTGEIRILVFDAGKRDYQTGMHNVRVTASGNGFNGTATTDSTGRHTFSGLLPGEYAVDATLEDHTPVYPTKPVQVPARGCVEVPIFMRLNRRITGQVLTKEGQPIKGVRIVAQRTRPETEYDMPYSADESTTDDNGRYELLQLREGDYYLGINLDRSPLPQNPDMRWFYPGTEDLAAAAVIQVVDRPGTTEYNLVLPDRPKERVIEGMVLWPDGRGAVGAEVVLEDPRWSWPPPSGIRADQNARFQVRAFSDRRYRLHAISHAQRKTTSTESVVIEPGEGQLELRLILTREGNSLAESSQKALDRWRKGLGL